MMEIQINLLPEKPKKNYFLFIFIGLSIGILALTLTVTVIYYQSLQQQLRSIQERIETTVQLQEMYTVENTNMADAALVTESVETLLEERISATFVLNELVKNLPRNGSFTEYQYDENGTVYIEAQFRTKREIASFLHHLKEMDMIQYVMLDYISEASTERKRSLYDASFSITLNTDQLKEAKGTGEE